MVRTGNTKFSAASVAKRSVILSKAVKKNFTLEVVVSRLRHHVWVLSKRLHSVTQEGDIFTRIVKVRFEDHERKEGYQGMWWLKKWKKWILLMRWLMIRRKLDRPVNRWLRKILWRRGGGLRLHSHR